MEERQDLISRQAAIDEISQYASIWMEYDGGMTLEEVAEAALKAAKRTMVHILEELPSAQPSFSRGQENDHRAEPCEDAVSRHRLLSDLEELIVAWEKYPVMAEQRKGVEAAIGYVKTIPSAQPEIVRCKDCKLFGNSEQLPFAQPELRRGEES